MADQHPESTYGGHILVPTDNAAHAFVADRETTVREIAVWDDRGHTPEEIADAHGCTLADVYAALAYFHDHEDAFRDHGDWDQVRDETPSKYHEKHLRRVEARRKLLREEVERYVEIVLDHYEPEQIILFGSLATDSVWSRSDVDLVIVMETDLPVSERTREVRELLRPCVEFYVIVYTPAELTAHIDRRNWVYTDIVRKGKVLYDRQSDAGNRLTGD